MAVLVSASGGGNWNTLASWRGCAAGEGAFNAALTTAQTAVTNTAYLATVAFTVTNGEVIEGVALHLKRNGTTGAFTVGLSDDGGSTYTREVTVNLTDLPSEYSWVFFAFASTLTADGGSDYKVAVKLSSGSSGLAIYRGSATTNDWSRILREDSAPGALSAGDVFYIFDDLTGAGARTANTITMDAIASAITDYGAVNIGQGTLSYGVAASTAYYLKLSGLLTIYGDGVFNIGTVGGAMPSTSTAVLEFDCTSDGEFGMVISAGGTMVAQGNPLAKVATLLTIDASVNATSLTVADSTGWLDNDGIVIASTTQTAAQTESGFLNGAASGTSLTIDGFAGAGGGLAYAHSGDAAGGPNNISTQAEVINLTRNVKIRSASSVYPCYLVLSGTMDWDYVEYYNAGSNNTAKAAFTIGAVTATYNIDFCGFYDWIYYGFYISSVGSNNAKNISNNVFGRTSSSTRSAFYMAGAPTNITLDDNWFIGGGTVWVQFVAPTYTINRWRVAGTTGGNQCFSTAATALLPAIFNDCVIHSNTKGPGVESQSTWNNCLIWRNGTGLQTGVSSVVGAGVNLNNCHFFGNTTYGISFSGTPNFVMKDCHFNGDAGYPTTYGVQSVGHAKVRAINCAFGALVAHAGADVYIGQYKTIDFVGYNTVFASTVEVLYHGTNSTHGFVRSSKHDGGSTHKAWYRDGKIESDVSVRHTESGYSWKLTPTTASFKLFFPGPTPWDTFKIAAVASAQATISAYVRKDATYNGAAPRLVVVGGIIGGISSDVSDAMSVGADTWEQLSVSVTPNEAGVVEFYLDCDGTAGSVYVDDITITQSGLPSTDNLDYPAWGLPLATPYTLTVGGGGGGGPVIGSRIIRGLGAI